MKNIQLLSFSIVLISILTASVVDRDFNYLD